MVDKIMSFFVLLRCYELNFAVFTFNRKKSQEGSKVPGELAGAWRPAHAHKKSGTKFHAS